MGQGVHVRPARRVESPVPELISVSRQNPREGITRGGLVRGAHPVVVDLPHQVWVPECKASAEKKRVESGSQARKGNVLEGKERVTGS